MLITAALIAKNEERFIGDCLKSIQSLVNEIVVVDTGSTDRTKDIAAGCGAKIFEFPWTGDFAAARNEALNRSSGEWILYIDADERVREWPEEDLRKLRDSSTGAGYFVRFHCRPGMTPYWEMRLFRNHPRIRFEGSMHENIWPAIRRYQMWEGGAIGYSGVVFDHVGYEGDQAHKHERNLPLLLEFLEKDPKRVYHWCHLAQTYAGLGKTGESRQAWEEGVRLVRRKRRSEPSDGFAYLGLIQMMMEAEDDVAGLLKEAKEQFPGILQFEWCEARYLMGQDRYEEAIPHLEGLIRHGEEQDFDLVAGYDTRLFGELSWSSLATCCYRAGRYSDARGYYEKAQECDPENLEYRVKEALCQKLVERQR